MLPGMRTYILSRLTGKLRSVTDWAFGAPGAPENDRDIDWEDIPGQEEVIDLPPHVSRAVKEVKTTESISYKIKGNDFKKWAGIPDEEGIIGLYVDLYRDNEIEIKTYRK